MRACTVAMSAVIASTRCSIWVSRNAWWSVNRPVSASVSRAVFERSVPRARSASTAGSRSPAISAAMIARPVAPNGSVTTAVSLIRGVLEQLLHPLLLRGASGEQVDPVAGQIPQLPDRRRRHEARAQHLPFGDLAQPHRIEPVGLRPARQVLDVLGVDQPGLKTGAPTGRTAAASSRWLPPSPPGSPR